MQFYKKTSIGKSYNYTSLILKIVLGILTLSLIIFFLGKINFKIPYWMNRKPITVIKKGTKMYLMIEKSNGLL